MDDIKSNEEHSGSGSEQFSGAQADQQGANSANETASQKPDADDGEEISNSGDGVPAACITSSAEREETTFETASSLGEQVKSDAQEAQKQSEPDKYGRDRDPFADLPPHSPQARCKHLHPQAVNMLVPTDHNMVQASRKLPGRPFRKGQSGNPLGRPKGSRNRSTLAAEALVDGNSNEILSKAIETARNGNVALLQYFSKVILPARRDRPVQFEMPPIETVEDAKDASAYVIAAVASGDLTPDEAEKIQKLIATHVKLLESAITEGRIIELENSAKDEKGEHQ